MSIPFVDLKAQLRSIEGEIRGAIDTILESTSFIGGKPVAEFETAFASYVGARFAVGTSSGTSALQLALVSCGIGRGDEVITVPNTFIATTEAITQAGASVRFVDVEPEFYNMDPNALEDAITPKTRCILPVHLFGQPADMGPILEIAEKRGLVVIADCAQAHGAHYQGKKLGSLGRAVCYSFYPGKNLGAYGDAGALVTNDEEVASHVRLMVDHGRVEKHDHTIEGFNHRLDAIQAAILSVKLRHLEGWLEKRRRAAALYKEKLQGLPLVLPKEGEGRRHVYHLFVVLSEERDRLRERLAEKGIATGLHYPIPVHLLKAYRHLGHRPGSFPRAERVASQGLSLPMYAELTEAQIDEVAGALREALHA
ncbi:MAG: DegT/DnrJ/EryC1/StrS family aminotransferase [Candidatus Eisenbacteria bacterium]|nr:DegT/DnrJ/EryC1/StrS family aminotransferase [Candidatus Eisenbacteria bacterium]